MAETTPPSSRTRQSLIERLTTLGIGGCTCDIKRPELTYHALNCRYRTVEEAAQFIAAAPAQVKDEVCWFVERPGESTPHEWLAVIDGGSMWTTDPQRAIRYASWKEANEACGSSRRLQGFEKAFASEHIFVARSETTPPTPWTSWEEYAKDGHRRAEEFQARNGQLNTLWDEAKKDANTERIAKEDALQRLEVARSMVAPATATSAHAELLAIHAACMAPDKAVALDGDTYTVQLVKEFIALALRNTRGA
jgi:hypothetical protein